MHRSLVAWWGNADRRSLDSSPVDDPFGIETVRFLQVLIGDDQLGDVAPRSENTHAQ